MRWSDDQIEDWLAQEQRLICGPGNQAIELVQSLLFWKQFDYLRDRCFISEEELVLKGLANKQRFQFPFSLSLQDEVAHVYKDYFERFGEDGCPTSYHRNRRVLFSVQSHHPDHDPEGLAAGFAAAALGDGFGIH